MTRHNQILASANRPFPSSPTRVPPTLPVPSLLSAPMNATMTAPESAGDASSSAAIKSRPQFKWVPTDTNVHNHLEHPYVQRRPKSPSPRSSPIQSSTALPLSLGGAPSNPMQSHLPTSSPARPLDAKVDPDRTLGTSAISRLGTHSDNPGPSSDATTKIHNAQHGAPIFFRPPTTSIASSSRGCSFSSSDNYLPPHHQYYPGVGAVSMAIDHQRHYASRTRAPGCLSLSIPARVKPWLPMATWFATTIGFVRSRILRFLPTH